MRMRGLVLAVGMTAVLAGCTALAPAPAGSADPIAEWAAHEDDFLAEHGDFPDGDPAYTDDEAHAALTVQADAAWANTVVSLFPDAVRPPSDGFVRWGENDDRMSLESDYADCLTSHGVTPTVGYSEDGSIAGIGTSSATEAEELGVFFCSWVAYPSRPAPPPNAAQLGYMWDYYDEFLVPCFEANGVPQTPIISRGEWIESFPRAHWTLEYPPEDADRDRLMEICSFDPIH